MDNCGSVDVVAASTGDEGYRRWLVKFSLTSLLGLMHLQSEFMFN